MLRSRPPSCWFACGASRLEEPWIRLIEFTRTAVRYSDTRWVRDGPSVILELICVVRHLPRLAVTSRASPMPARIGELLRVIDGYEGTLEARCALRLAPRVFVRPGELHKAEWSGDPYGSYGITSKDPSRPVWPRRLRGVSVGTLQYACAWCDVAVCLCSRHCAATRRPTRPATRCAISASFPETTCRCSR